MNSCRHLLGALLVGILVAASQGAHSAHGGCTSFCFSQNGKLFFAHNLDYPNELADGLIFANPSGLTKHGWVSNYLGNWEPDEKSENEEWTSEYGSLTFHTVGFQMPSAGINERGLTVAILDHLEASPPKDSDHPHIESTVFLQYLLDTCADIDEVEAAADRFVVDGPSHYLAADAKGNTAVIEFVNQRTEIQLGNARIGTVLTNATYTSLLAAFKQPGKADSDDDYKSLARFCTVRKLLDGRGDSVNDPIQSAFDALDAAKQPTPTQWSIVFDISGDKIFFKTRVNPRMRKINLSTIDLPTLRKVRMLPVQHSPHGNITNLFFDYSHEKSLAHTTRFVKNFLEEKNLKGPSDVDAWVDRTMRHLEIHIP